jgi:hypothetical protein
LGRGYLSHLEEEFTEEEVYAVIKDLAWDKAPGPNNFIGFFFKTTWNVIKADILLAVHYFFQQHAQHLSHLNTTHSFAKLISKILANRIAPELNSLISWAQSAFIKRRSIHDNFLFTQNLIKALHRAKQACIFLKLDIVKAFDTVTWDYLLEVIAQFGFGTKWRGWVSDLLSSASTVVLLNGTRGNWFKHFAGLRQGHPLSPMLFILATEPLQRLLDLATVEQLLTPINNRAAKLRMSMYADDAAIFLNPIKEDLQVVSEILDIFGKASGLVINRGKCAAYPVRCDELDFSEVMEGFNCPIKAFPCCYLGLPLHYRALTRVDVPPVFDKLASRLASWKGKFLNKVGRHKLINNVLTSIPTYFL